MQVVQARRVRTGKTKIMNPVQLRIDMSLSPYSAPRHSEVAPVPSKSTVRHLIYVRTYHALTLR